MSDRKKAGYYESLMLKEIEEFERKQRESKDDPLMTDAWLSFVHENPANRRIRSRNRKPTPKPRTFNAFRDSMGVRQFRAELLRLTREASQDWQGEQDGILVTLQQKPAAVFLSYESFRELQRGHTTDVSMNQITRLGPLLKKLGELCLITHIAVLVREQNSLDIFIDSGYEMSARKAAQFHEWLELLLDCDFQIHTMDYFKIYTKPELYDQAVEL